MGFYWNLKLSSSSSSSFHQFWINLFVNSISFVWMRRRSDRMHEWKEERGIQFNRITKAGGGGDDEEEVRVIVFWRKLPRKQFFLNSLQVYCEYGEKKMKSCNVELLKSWEKWLKCRCRFTRREKQWERWKKKRTRKRRENDRQSMERERERRAGCSSYYKNSWLGKIEEKYIHTIRLEDAWWEW